tara:strand:+ start:2626 stop:3204 length:579 start_codon:yes stop_codon:yes gene_type:complete
MESSKSCWKCKNKIDFNSFLCGKCNTVQQLFDLNPYDIFSLEKKFDIDNDLLEDKYLELQNILHPDKFINYSEKERSLSNAHSSNINNAYEKLNNNVSRVKLLLSINGYDTAEDDRSFKDTSMLEEIMELQNKCMSIQNDSEFEKLKSQLELKIEDEKKKITTFFNQKNFEEAHKTSIKLSYLEKIKDNLVK